MRNNKRHVFGMQVSGVCGRGGGEARATLRNGEEYETERMRDGGKHARGSRLRFRRRRWRVFVCEFSTNPPRKCFCVVFAANVVKCKTTSPSSELHSTLTGVRSLYTFEGAISLPAPSLDSIKRKATFPQRRTLLCALSKVRNVLALFPFPLHFPSTHCRTSRTSGFQLFV